MFERIGRAMARANVNFATMTSNFVGKLTPRWIAPPALTRQLCDLLNFVSAIGYIGPAMLASRHSSC
jgi:hypothetical protein